MSAVSAPYGVRIEGRVNNMGDRSLGTLNSDEVGAAAARGAIVLLPVGAFEQHGPHLPLDVDIHIAETVARGAAERLPDAFVAPPVPWGQSANHLPFPGTLSLSPQTMTDLLADISGSLIGHGFKRLVFVDFHMSNRALVTVASRLISQRYGVTPIHVFCSDFASEVFAANRKSSLGGELHAGEFETSVELYLRPELVQLDRAAPNPVDPERHFGSPFAQSDMFAGGVVQTGIDLREAAPTGVLGDPTVASAELGKLLVNTMVENIALLIEGLRFETF